MPTYTSEVTSVLCVAGPCGYATIQTGENELSFYLKYLPEGVTFTSHAPLVSPYVRVVDETSFPGDDLDVYLYTTVVVANKTDSICVIYANGDTTNTFEVATGATLTIENKQDWGTLTLHSAGSGTVSVWGIV